MGRLENMTATGVRGAAVMFPDGGIHVVKRVTWPGGRFHIDNGSQRDGSQRIRTGPGDASAVHDADGHALIDGHGLWLVPGFIDAHVHIAWSDFSQRVRRRRSPEERLELTRRALRATLCAGFTSIRDAGGASAGTVTHASPSPRVLYSLRILGRRAADEAGGLQRAVEQVLDAGADWVKIAATPGIGSDEAPDQAQFSAAELSDAVRLAAERGIQVMVHALGGDAITWAIEAGAASVEHGVFLTEDQARLGAERGVVLVPTVRIYQLIRVMVRAGKLPAAMLPRVERVIRAHPVAVRRARDAGMPVAVGTDYGASAQHGRNREEIAALVDAGLSSRDALRAATRTGARLLSSSGKGRAEQPGGEIREGAVADALLLTVDPRDVHALVRPGAVTVVVVGGRAMAQQVGDRSDVIRNSATHQQ